MTKPPDNLTDKQRRFCEEYVVDWNATQAAIRAGFKPKKAGRNYFVYCLIDSQSGVIFYIGKGKGNRHLQHLKEYRKGIISNALKFSAIKEIEESGGNISALILHDNLTETESLDVEGRYIAKIPGLTNIAKGSYSRNEALLAYAKVVLSEMPSPEEVEDYPMIRFKNGEIIDRRPYYYPTVNALNEIIAGLEKKLS